MREVINERVANVNETLNKRVDNNEAEVRQQITETKVGLEKTDETIIQLRVEVEARINQIENNNDTRVKAVSYTHLDVYKRQY